MGVRGVPLQWLRSYMTDRKSATVIDDRQSSTILIRNGVPQGGILSPLLYTLYINDFGNHISQNHTIYADDTTIIFHTNSIDDIQNELDALHASLQKYFDANCLKMNTSKTQILICGHHQSITLRFGDSYVDSSTTASFLGLMIDSRLTFDNHIIHILKCLSRSIPAAYNISNLLASNCKLLFYNSFFMSHIAYALPFIALSHTGYIKKLFTFQKKFIKVLFNLPVLTPSSKLFFPHLPIFDIYHCITFYTCCSMHHIYYHTSPKSILKYNKL